MTASERTIFHICRRAEWDAAVRSGFYDGSSQDESSGFIHFSTAGQVVASAAKHRAGQSGLVLIEAAVAALGAGLKWEPSRPDRGAVLNTARGDSPARHGALFPHLYGRMPASAAVRVLDLPLGSDGRHVFPPELEARR